MEHVFYKSLSMFINFFIIFTFLILTAQIYQTFAQQISEEEKAGMMAQKFLNESTLQQKGDGGNSPAAIQEKFFTGASCR